MSSDIKSYLNECLVSVRLAVYTMVQVAGQGTGGQALPALAPGPARHLLHLLGPPNTCSNSASASHPNSLSIAAGRLLLM